VNTTHDSYHAKKLVITAGAWATQLIPGLSRHLTVTRQAVGWVQPKQPNDYSLGNFPCWFIEDNDREFYGFPMVPPDKMGGPAGLKLAMHAPTGEPTHPDAVNRSPQKQDEAVLLEALQRFLPGVEPSALTIKTCLYTNSPDQHFILDFLPGSYNQVAVATGFSGHGFKFVSVVGEIMADLVIKGSTSLPIGFLNAERFG
jgi:sarcosine oxidase